VDVGHDGLWYSGNETRLTDPSSFFYEVLEDGDSPETIAAMKRKRARVKGRLKRKPATTAEEKKYLATQIAKEIEDATLIPYERLVCTFYIQLLALEYSCLEFSSCYG